MEAGALRTPATNCRAAAKTLPSRSSQKPAPVLNRAYNACMRRLLTAALLLAMTALPVCAQRRGIASPRVGASVGVRPSGRVIVRGGFGFGHNPRVGVFFNQRSFHHRRSVRPFFPYYPYAYGYPYAAYPYYGYGLQSDFVYSSAAAQPAYSPQPSYMAEHDTGMQNDLNRLQAE